jgi:murein tripeptide amidase MpaA
MLNPDGVINGNHRCSLAQVDLNRVYTSPLLERHPEVWHIKEMVKNLQQERDVVAYVDLHGHSAKKNVSAHMRRRLSN